VRPRVVIYSRVGCHLCEEVRALVDRVSERIALEIVELDIDADPALRAEFDTEVPVVELNDREIARFRLTEERLMTALRSAGCVG